MIDADSRQRLGAAAEDDALQLSRLAALETGERFSDLESVVEGIMAADPSVLADPAGCETARAILSKRHSEVIGYYLLDGQGGILCESPSGFAITGSSSSLYQQVILEQRPLAGNTRDAGTNTSFVDILVPLGGQMPGQTAGILYSSASMQSIGQVVPVPPGSALLLVDSTGYILTRVPDPQKLIGKRLPDADLITQILQRGSGTTRMAGLDGVDRIYAFTPVAGSSTIYSAIGIPASVIFSDSDRLYRLNLILLALVTVSVLTVTWLFSKRVILEPVHTLVEASQRLADGDLSARTRLTAETELGQLGSSFDHMAAALADRSARLHDAEQYYQTLLETTPVSILAMDPSGKIAFANAQASRLLELSPTELSSRTAADPRWVVLDMDGKKIDTGDLFNEIIQNKDLSRDLGNYYLVDSHGVKHLLSVKSTLIIGDSGSPQGVMVVLYDITEPTQRLAEFEAIAHLANALRTANSVEEISTATLGVASRILEAQGAMLGVSQPESGELIFEAGTGAWKDIKGRVLPAGQGVSSEVMASGVPYLNNDIISDTRLYRLIFGDEIKAGLCVPLANQDKTIGVVWAGRERPFTDQDSRLLSAMADIAANAILRARLLEQTRRSLERLSALHTIDLAITSSLDRQITLDVVLDQVMTELKPDAAVIYTFRADLDRLQVAASRGVIPSLVGNERVSLGGSPAGEAAQMRKIISLTDLTAGDSTQRNALVALFPGAGACFSAPLIVKGQVKGVLQVLFRNPYQPAPAWLEFLDTLSTQAGIALESTDLFQQLQAALGELNQAYDATIEGWARALEMRSQEERGHSERLTRLAVELAQRLGISGAELTDFRRGVLMHDIGKMALPEDILLKPGQLNPDEWELVRKHPLMARELLARIPSLYRAMQIPVYHHERWNGSGYPEGLQKFEIPFAARVYAVIDVWDALTSDQPYRKAWTESQALNYLEENSGILFDPQVVGEFLKMQEGVKSEE